MTNQGAARMLRPMRFARSCAGMAENKNLYALLEAQFRSAGDAPAFVVPDARTVTYKALSEDVGRMANALTKLGVRPGDRVMAQVEKSIENVVLYLATLKAGAVFNPLNTAYMPAELEYFIDDAEPAVIVMPMERLAKIEGAAALKNVPALLTMETDGSGSMLDLARQQPAAHDTVARADDDLACLLYTSGTTGRSKGAMLTHKNLSSNAEVLHAYWKFQKGDVLLHALPIFHTHGLFVALHTAFLNASKIHWLTRFDLDAVMKLLPQSTVMMGVPTFYTRLLGTPAFMQDHCSKMRLFISGSAPLLAETHQEFEARTGQRILERYGMTEAGMITSNPYANDGRVAGSVGYALPGIELRVAAENGRVLPAGEVGVLEMRGPNLFKGYWRNPEKTKEEFRDDGFFITGDLATIDADGRVTIVGRAKDLIISGGFNVYPKEIETEINLLPGVAESAVLGVPHPDFGEGVIAVVTPAAGASLPGEEQLIGTLSERLAKFKLPKRVFVMQELPRNAMGKVQKAELRDRYSALFKS
jgi:malonyl-CoA/methylmalonyl-CoA synthetase